MADNKPPRNYHDGVLPDWFIDYAVHPLAYGGDQAMNDLFGPRGLLQPITTGILGAQEWQPNIAPPVDLGADIISEIPRAYFTSGGLAGASRAVPMMTGGAVAGFARDPGAKKSPDEQLQARKENAVIGGAGAGLGALGGVALARGAEKFWQTLPWNKAKTRMVQEYGAFGEGYKGAKYAHENPGEFEEALEVLPTKRGTLRRGIRPDHPHDIKIVNGLKEGDVWEPGKALSADEGGDGWGGYHSEEAARGGVNELDEAVPKWLPEDQRGPYIHITTNNARDARGVLGWDEFMTRPSSKMRVDKVVRDKDGRVTDVYVTDLSKASFGRQASDVTKSTSRTVVQQTTPGAFREGADRGSQKWEERDSRRHGRSRVRNWQFPKKETEQ